jgi:hypothetical protein
MGLPNRMAFVCLYAYLAVSVSVMAAEQIDLSPLPEPNGLTQVSVELEASGNTLLRSDTDDTSGNVHERRLPMNATARLRYAERSFPGRNPGRSGIIPLAARYYELAEAKINVDEKAVAPQLADERRLIVVISSTPRPVLFSPNGPLKREELDLVDVLGSSSVIDQLLPGKAVADGDSWPAEPATVAALLTLDSIAVCEVQSVLEEFNASFAKVRVAGVVHGTAEGAATEQEIRGVYLFDRRLRRITRLNLAVREKRSIGGATPGLDAVAKLQIKLEPIKNHPQLDDLNFNALMPPEPAATLDLTYDAPTLGFQLQHDRKWFITSEEREAVTLRRVDGNDVVAQCTLVSLPPKSAGRQTTLEQFQKDVLYSLGKNAGELVRTRQWQNSHEHYCYEVVVLGKVEDMPVEWHHFLVARESGHRVSLATTIEGPMVERVATADRALIEQLKLYPPMPAAQTAGREHRDSAR